MMSRKRDVEKSAHMEASRYTSDIFSLVSDSLIVAFEKLQSYLMPSIIIPLIHIKTNFRSEPFYFGSIGLVSTPL